MREFLMSLFVPVRRRRGESAKPKGIGSTFVPSDMSIEEWQKGGWHKYLWGEVEERIKKQIK